MDRLENNINKQTTTGRQDHRDGKSDSDDFVVRGLMKKHEDHVRVLEALIYNQETLISLKDAKIEELQDGKQQVEHLLAKLQDNQLFYDDQSSEWEQERQLYDGELKRLKDINQKLVDELAAQTEKTQKLKNKIQNLKELVLSLNPDCTDARLTSTSSSTSAASQLNGFTTTVTQQFDEVENWNWRELELETERLNLQQLLEASRSDLEEMSQLVRTLETKLEETAAEKRKLEEQLESAGNNNEELIKVVSNFEAENNNLKRLQAEHQQLMESQQEQLRRREVDEQDSILYQQQQQLEQSPQIVELPSNIQRQINIKVQYLTVARSTRRRTSESDRNSSTQLLHRPESLTNIAVHPVLEVEGDDSAVYGLSILDGELYVVRWKRPGVIEVYDAATDFSPLRLMTIEQLTPPEPSPRGRLRGLLSYYFSKQQQQPQQMLHLQEPAVLSHRLTDIVSCCINSCLYVSDLTNCAVLRLRPSDAVVLRSWNVDGGAYGLSTTDRGTVIVCCTATQQVREYTSDGELVRNVTLPGDCFQPWHAVQLTADRLLFCHGGRFWNDDVGRLMDDPLHRVCMIDVDDGQLVGVHGEVPGADDQLVCYPLYLTVLGRPASSCYFLLVADCDNNRIKLLDNQLTHLGEVLGPGDGLRGPYRLVVCPVLGLMIVGLVDGRIVVYNLHDLGLLPSHYADVVLQRDVNDNNIDVDSVDADVFEDATS